MEGQEHSQSILPTVRMNIECVKNVDFNLGPETLSFQLRARSFETCTQWTVCIIM